MMKRNYILIVLLIMLCGAAKAQPPGPEDRKEKREEVESMKIGFITKALDLSTEESQKFWPVYNQFNNELDQLRKDHRGQAMKLRNNIDEISDKELEVLVDSELEFRQAELDIRKKYQNQFKQVLPMKKVAKLYKADEDFKRELLKMLNNNQRNQRKPAPR